jgi:pimeloyl-ACP methyl ester carboxylesterase
VPTLGVFGTNDPYFAEEGMVRSERYVDAPWEYVRIAGAGHWLPIEQPERVAALIAGWSAAA